jgi:hypothetical protein
MIPSLKFASKNADKSSHFNDENTLQMGIISAMIGIEDLQTTAAAAVDLSTIMAHAAAVAKKKAVVETFAVDARQELAEMQTFFKDAMQVRVILGFHFANGIVSMEI